MEPRATRLLSAVWGSRDGYVFITYKRGDVWTEPAALPIVKGKVDFDSVEIPHDADQYWCPVVFTQPKRRKENAGPTNVLWADLDPVHPDRCRLKPSIAWESSPGRYQALWFLNQDIDGEQAAALSKRIAYADGADKGGWDLTQVLRIPGSKNFKYEGGPKGQILWAQRSAYSPTEVKNSYPALNGASASSQSDQVWADLPEATIQTSIASLPIGLRRRLSQSTEGADRSLELQKLARDLIRWGLDSTVVLHLLQRSSWNKFSGRQDEKEQLLQQVSSAIAAVQRTRSEKKKTSSEVTSTAGSVTVDATEFEEPLQRMEIHQWTDFLSIPTHLKWLVEDTWVDQTVGFISGRSKSFKTWIALDLGLSILSGKPFLGMYPVGRTGPVLLIQEEDPAAILQERLRLIAKSKGMLPRIIDGATPKVFTIEYPEYPLHIINLQGFQLTNKDKLSEVRERIALIKPVMVIVDPFINVLGEINEHQATEMVTVLQIMKMWREEFGCNVCVVHHWNKTKTEEGDRGGAHMYGSFALHAWLESALHIEPIIDPETERIDTVTVEREFKAAPGSRTLKLRFEIDTAKEFTYNVFHEGVLESSKSLQTVLDVLTTHGDWMTTGNLSEATGYPRPKVSELAGRLRKIGKIEYRPGGGRGKSSAYKAK